MNRGSWDSASSHWFKSLQCASPQLRPPQSKKPSVCCCCPYRGRKALLTADLLSSALPLQRTITWHHTRPLCSFGGQTGFLCGRKEEETEGGISVLLFGPQGEEPVVDSTLQRETALHTEVRYRLRNTNYCVFYLLERQTFKRAFRRIFCYCWSWCPLKKTWRWRWMRIAC